MRSRSLVQTGRLFRNECWPACYYLADLYRNAGEIELASRAYRAVISAFPAASLTPASSTFRPTPAGEMHFSLHINSLGYPLLKQSEGDNALAIDIKKFITRFIEEARDHVLSSTTGLLHKQSCRSGMHHTIFRSAHTIKGSSRMLKLATITETAHKLEDVMQGLRDGKLLFSRRSDGCFIAVIPSPFWWTSWRRPIDQPAPAR
jgi:HPt (histidine-containing phosphotransfer) domain-containing protein